MMKVFLAGVVGGVIVFAWGAFSHMVLPIGEMGGIQSLPNEEVLLEEFRNTLPEAGLYFFPGMIKSPSPEEREEWKAKYQSGPAGILVYQPIGGEPLSLRKLLNELLSDILAAVLAAFVVIMITASYMRRVMAVTLLGLFAWVSISVSYWNWYGFPGSFIAMEAMDQVVGWLLGGLAIAKIAKS